MQNYNNFKLINLYAFLKPSSSAQARRIQIEIGFGNQFQITKVN